MIKFTKNGRKVNFKKFKYCITKWAKGVHFFLKQIHSRFLTKKITIFFVDNDDTNDKMELRGDLDVE